jgi:hypothetical protein
MMVAGKPRDYCLTSDLGEISGTESSMVQVRGQSARWTQPEFRQGAGGRPSEDTEAGMLLPNVMEKSGTGQISAVRRQQTHLLCGAHGVPPVCSSLPEEQCVFGAIVEQGFDEPSFRFIEGSCRRDLEEPSE